MAIDINALLRAPEVVAQGLKPIASGTGLNTGSFLRLAIVELGNPFECSLDARGDISGADELHNRLGQDVRRHALTLAPNKLADESITSSSLNSTVRFLSTPRPVRGITRFSIHNFSHSLRR